MIIIMGILGIIMGIISIIGAGQPLGRASRKRKPMGLLREV